MIIKAFEILYIILNHSKLP